MITVSRERYVVKTYNISELLDPIGSIEFRTEKIQNLTKGLVTFDFRGDVLIRKTKRLQLQSFRSQALSLDLFTDLSSFVTSCHKSGLVHGDICIKNLKYFSNKLLLTDWEPSLRQIRNNKICLMGTYPFIDPDDIKNNQISQKTDLYCLERVKGFIRD